MLLFWLWPNFSTGFGNFFWANVLGDSFCPKGDGLTFVDEILVKVNKTTPIPEDYIPKDLTKIPKNIRTTKSICLKQEVLGPLALMFQDAEKDNIFLAVTSGFRSKNTQANLYKALFAIKGEKAQDRIAMPLHSEHHLGTTMDLSGQSIDYLSANDLFSGTAEDTWLRSNAYKYGFVMSYPESKTKITGYDFEPWHYRFVGKEAAQEIFDSGLSLEEYLKSELSIK